MTFKRSAGVLLHISSLPGDFGIGDLGERAHWFIDFLAAAGQSYWQILPLGPDDAGNPYMAQSTWAGSPFLVSLEALERAGDLIPSELSAARVPQGSLVDYGFISRTRRELLSLAAQRFFASGRDRSAYDKFCEAESDWLDDWALFSAARQTHGNRPWWEWPRDIALRTPQGIKSLRESCQREIDTAKYVQFRFFQQLDALRKKAASAGIRLIGDVPIYCSRDSADVWAAREYFQLDDNGAPKLVSGVPPDYFAKDGQLWGSPIYDWQRLEKDGFRWWIRRVKAVLRQCDVLRIDHFRAFEAYWAIPATAATAREGRWVKGPGDAFFAAVKEALGGQMPFIAEDLGIITKGVRELRDRWDLPGMRVLQFAFGEDAASPHLPIRHTPNSVVYTGTHDNDTTVGWYEKASAIEKDLFRRYTATDGGYCHYHMIRLAYGSIASLAIVPMQDVLGLGTWARFNIPGLVEGNWKWKLLPEQLGEAPVAMLHEMAEVFGRLPWQKQAEEMDDAQIEAA